MRDIDSAFDHDSEIDTAFRDLRGEVAPNVVAPEPGTIIGRARRRARVRYAALGAAAVVAAGGLLVVKETGTMRDEVVTPPAVTGVPTTRPRGLGLADLVYAEKELKDRDDPRKRYTTSKLWNKVASSSILLPACGAAAKDPLDPWDGDIPGTVNRYEIEYDGNPESGNERTSSKLGEQVIAFADVGQARHIMDLLISGVEACGQPVQSERPALGSQAVRFSRFDPGDGSDPTPQTQEGVAVRQGSVIAIYSSLRNEGPKLTTLDDLERNAQAMVTRLASLGYRD
ncbi:hypothetical protein [Actinomadura sp. 6N118]|uniref:hypothetical protein n=1 Tax=Actinomadura sp. 6N118 TaxID=3375151 RepID=UPI00379AD3FB